MIRNQSGLLLSSLTCFLRSVADISIPDFFDARQHLPLKDTAKNVGRFINDTVEIGKAKGRVEVVDYGAYSGAVGSDYYARTRVFCSHFKYSSHIAHLHFTRRLTA